jgi:hypothetical protein
MFYADRIEPEGAVPCCSLFMRTERTIMAKKSPHPGTGHKTASQPARLKSTKSEDIGNRQWTEEERQARTEADVSGLMDEPMPYHIGMAELVFEVVQEPDGGYCAECLTENIFTEGDTWQQLRENVLEATTAFFFDRPRPERVRLHLVRDEILSVA